MLAPPAPQACPSAGGLFQKGPQVPVPAAQLCVLAQLLLEVATVQSFGCCHGYHCTCRHVTLQMKSTVWQSKQQTHQGRANSIFCGRALS